MTNKNKLANLWGLAKIFIAAAFILLCTAVIIYVMQELMSGPNVEQRARQDETAKLAFIERYRPRWYDVDPHGSEEYVTYKIKSRQTGAIGLCKGEAQFHHGRWFVIGADKCTKIGQAKPDRKSKQRTQPNPLAWLMPDTETA